MSDTNTGNEVINSTENSAANTAQDNAGSGKLSPALKKELRNIFIYILIGLCIMFVVFFVIMCIFPEIKSNEEFEYWKIALGGIGGETRPGIVHRLDKDTSGLMLVAKNDETQEALSNALRDRTVEKHYRALVEGKMKELAWIVIAILVPCFNYISGIIPLLFPSFGIKIASIIFKKN